MGVTSPARICQADMDRAVRAAAKADHARVIFRLEQREIEIIIGDVQDRPADTTAPEDDEDYG